MFSHLLAVAFLALPLLTAATPAAEKRQSGCNTGPMQCCDQYGDASTHTGSALSSALGQPHHPSSVFGFNCSPITNDANETTGIVYEANPVCCANNALGGLISIGCIFL